MNQHRVPRETKQMILILTNCCNASGLLPSGSFYKLGHNAAVSQSIPHFLWDKLDDLCAECGLEDTHKYTQTLAGTCRHCTCRIVGLAHWR